jgi:hypothetical protein
LTGKYLSRNVTRLPETKEITIAFSYHLTGLSPLPVSPGEMGKFVHYEAVSSHGPDDDTKRGSPYYFLSIIPNYITMWEDGTVGYETGTPFYITKGCEMTMLNDGTYAFVNRDSVTMWNPITRETIKHDFPLGSVVGPNGTIITGDKTSVQNAIFVPITMRQRGVMIQSLFNVTEMLTDLCSIVVDYLA